MYDKVAKALMNTADKVEGSTKLYIETLTIKVSVLL